MDEISPDPEALSLTKSFLSPLNSWKDKNDLDINTLI